LILHLPIYLPIRFGRGRLFLLFLVLKMEPSVTGPMAVPMNIISVETAAPTNEAVIDSILEALIASENKNADKSDLVETVLEALPSSDASSEIKAVATSLKEQQDEVASAVASTAVEALIASVSIPEVKVEEEKGAVAKIKPEEENDDNNDNGSPPPAKKPRKTPCSCELCGLVCASKYNCKRHQRLKHPQGISEESSVAEAAVDTTVEVCTAEDAPKLISCARVYDYGNGMFAMITNIMPPMLSPSNN
jgi:hypothetical protein